MSTMGGQGPRPCHITNLINNLGSVSPSHIQTSTTCEKPTGHSLIRSVCRISVLLVILMGVIGCTPHLGSDTRGWTPVTAADDVVYAGTREGKVIALYDDGSVPTVKWVFPSGDDTTVSGTFYTPVIGNDLIYVTAVDGFVYALEKDTGRSDGRGWKRELVDPDEGQSLVAGPALDTLRQILIVGSENGYLYALDAVSSEELWRFKADGKIWTTPEISNGIVYFGSHDKNIYALDISTGKEKWRTATDGVIVAKPFVWNDLVIVGSFDRKVYALDSRYGEIQWEFETKNWIWGSAIGNNRSVFVGSMDGNVYSLDNTGVAQWSHELGSPIVSTPVLVPRGLVVASIDGKLTLLETATGDTVTASLTLPDDEIKAPLYTIPLDESDLSTTGVQASGGNQRESVFIGSQEGTILRIQIKSVQSQLWCFDTKEKEPCG